MQISTLMQKLKDQNDKVIIPLVKEVKVITEVHNRVKADLERAVKQLKAMTAVLRLPAMTSKY